MFMQKTTVSLTPVPKPPTTAQMIEDINSSTPEDPVFIEGSAKKMFEERTKLDVKFDTIKEFVEANRNLNNVTRETEEKLSKLLRSREELHKVSESIRDQAVKALN